MYLLVASTVKRHVSLVTHAGSSEDGTLYHTLVPQLSVMSDEKYKRIEVQDVPPFRVKSAKRTKSLQSIIFFWSGARYGFIRKPEKLLLIVVESDAGNFSLSSLQCVFSPVI